MILDVFNDDAFSMQSLTDAMQSLPFMPNRIGELNLFQDKPVPTLDVAIEEKDGVLSLISTKARGQVGDTAQRKTRRMRTFRVPHLPQDDSLLADDLQGVRAFGQETQVELFSTVVNEKLADMRSNHEVTDEWHRMGALKGEILDADGSTIYDLFAEFGLTEDVHDFIFSVSTTDIKGTCTAVIRDIRDGLGADTFTGVHALCGDNFFDLLVDHDKVKEAYDRWNSGEFLRSQQFQQGFTYGGITWENYRGSIGATDFLDTDEARFFPVGTAKTFTRYLSPAPFMDTVNTMGKPLYARQWRKERDTGVDIHTETNPLFMCRRPSSLKKGTHS